MDRERTPVSATEEAAFRLAAIVESSDDAIVAKNLDGIVTNWNHAAVKLFGYFPEEIIGQSILTIIPSELHGEEREILRKIRSGEKIEHYETQRVRKDGQSIEVSLTISPIRDRNGNVIGSSKIARDISQRKKMERLLIRTEKIAATGRMAALIAHEINNPLDSVLNLVYLARTTVRANDPALQYLVTAEKELVRVSHIARKTLGYYRDPGTPVEIRLEEMFEEILTAWNAKLVSRHISVDCEYQHHDPLFSNKDDLIQIFLNLISNAVDAMPQGGTIKITTHQQGNSGIEIVIRDSGVGIQANVLENVFDAFFTTKGQSGTGIGLWVARHLAERHGGSISLSSQTETPVNGTTVKLFFQFQENVPAKEDRSAQRRMQTA